MNNWVFWCLFSAKEPELNQVF